MDKRVLVLSAYDALSHRRWREGLVDAFPEYKWTVLALPPRHFSWRIRGNSLTWAYSARQILEQPYDLVVATSMTDLAALRGMVPNLTKFSNLVYFHENQFSYPHNASEHSDLEAKIVTLYTALCGDKILFNTRFNQETFLQGVRDLLERFPDHVPGGIVEYIAGRGDVLPVPLDDTYFTRNERPSVNGPFTILWNHRWEYDKAPERFFSALAKLRDAGIEFRVHVIGQQFRERPKAFDDIERTLSAHIGAWGQVEEKESYRKVLRSSHVVVSNALHDFQGLSVLEAVASGCVPVVPNRLAYRELFDPEYRYPSYPDDLEKEAEALAQRLTSLAIAYAERRFPTPPDVSRLSWRNLAPGYQKIFEAITHYCD